jgi:molecular chaperone GrpE
MLVVDEAKVVEEETMETPSEEAEEEKPETEAEEGEAEVGEAEEVAEIEEAAALRQQLEEAQTKADRYLDQLQRKAAEFANYKKRAGKEQAEFVRQANAALITVLLPILDDFERAFQTVPDGLGALTWIDGILLIYRKIQAIFGQLGVELIETTGQVFDPTLHQAITHEESAECDEGSIIAEVQKGYRLHDRVLRPALVRVSKGRPAADREQTGANEEQTGGET